MVVDVFTFNGEYDLLEIRLNVLDKYVGQFIIVEATETFSGKVKPLYYEEKSERYRKWHHKIKYYVVSDYPFDEEIIHLSSISPNVPINGPEHWKREFYQKESIKKALTHLKDEDICFIGDVDEIWNEESLASFHSPFKIRLDVYTYYLNNRSSEEFWGTLVSPYKFIKNECLNHLRTSAWKTIFYGGWHFTSMGGVAEVHRKLSDSYTDESYYTPYVREMLETNIHRNRDFLGRDFIYVIDESNWPQYLKDHKKEYIHLCHSNPI